MGDAVTKPGDRVEAGPLKLWVGLAVILTATDGAEVNGVVQDFAAQGVTVTDGMGGPMHFLPWHRIFRVDERI